MFHVSEKAQRREPEKARQPRRGSLAAPPAQELEAYASAQPYLTAYSLAERFGLRLSLAKDLLEGLERRGVLSLVTGTNRLRIYAPAARPVAVEQAEATVSQEAGKERKRRQAGGKPRKKEQAPSSG